MKNKDYTGLTLKKETKEKLNEFKGNDSYEKAIDKLLNLAGGVIIDDIEEIKRPQIAFELLSIGYAGNEDNLKEQVMQNTIVTFKELSQAKVRDKFYSPDINNMYYHSEWAEIIFKDENSVLIRVITEEELPNSSMEDISMLHISLF